MNYNNNNVSKNIDMNTSCAKFIRYISYFLWALGSLNTELWDDHIKGDILRRDLFGPRQYPMFAIYGVMVLFIIVKNAMAILGDNACEHSNSVKITSLVAGIFLTVVLVAFGVNVFLAEKMKYLLVFVLFIITLAPLPIIAVAIVLWDKLDDFIFYVGYNYLIFPFYHYARGWLLCFTPMLLLILLYWVMRLHCGIDIYKLLFR